VNNVTA